MSGRAKITALVLKLRTDSERCLMLANKLVDKAVSTSECAEALEIAAASLTDERCDEITKEMPDTVSAAN